VTRLAHQGRKAARAARAAERASYVGPEQRRSTGLLRIPFVRRCHVTFERGHAISAFLVNLNVLGAYIAHEEQPILGEAVECRFTIPGNEIEVVAGGVVAWLNPLQNHPVHSLPPGFGVRFDRLSDRDRSRVTAMVASYIARSALMRR
jgi:hypothetical protein